MVVNILFITTEGATKSEIKKFSKLVFGDLLTAWTFRKRLRSFQLLGSRRLCKRLGTPVVDSFLVEAEKGLCCAVREGLPLPDPLWCHFFVLPVPMTRMSSNTPISRPPHPRKLGTAFGQLEDHQVLQPSGPHGVCVCVLVCFVGVSGGVEPLAAGKSPRGWIKRGQGPSPHRLALGTLAKHASSVTRSRSLGQELRMASFSHWDLGAGCDPFCRGWER